MASSAELRNLLVEVLPRLGGAGMVHNGHLARCPRSADDWIDTDVCRCGRDDLISRVATAISGGGEGDA